MASQDELKNRALKAQANARQYLAPLSGLKPFGGKLSTVIPGDLLRINPAAVRKDNTGPMASADLKVGAAVVVHRFTDATTGADLGEYRKGAMVNVFFASEDNADWLKGGRRGVRHFPVDARALVPATKPQAVKGMQRTVQLPQAAAPKSRKRSQAAAQAAPTVAETAAAQAAARDAVVARITGGDAS